MNLPTTLITALAVSSAPPKPPPAPGVVAAASPAPVPAPAAALPRQRLLEGEMNGTREDLADFLRRHRRALRLRFFDRWGDPEFPIHSFVSLLENAPFCEANGSRSCAMHFTIFPF